MSLTKRQAELDRLVSPFFDTHVASRQAATSAIRVNRSGASWRGESGRSYFVNRPRAALAAEDFEFAWTDPDVVLRLAESGYGSGLTAQAATDLISLHEELRKRNVSAGGLSDDIYVMF